MLEFIVLGQVPGTHIQITIAWYIMGLLVGLIYFDLKVHRARKNQKSAHRAKRVEVIRPGQV
jgi:uncharacterized membrane protein